MTVVLINSADPQCCGTRRIKHLWTCWCGIVVNDGVVRCGLMQSQMRKMCEIPHLLLVELTTDIGWFMSSFTTVMLSCHRKEAISLLQHCV